jgi:hypothetical protein
MKMKFALATIIALGAAALIGAASAMPIASMGQAALANVETVAVVCGRHGCVRTRPVYHPYAHRYYRGPYVHRY